MWQLHTGRIDGKQGVFAYALEGQYRDVPVLIDNQPVIEFLSEFTEEEYPQVLSAARKCAKENYGG